MLLDEAEITRAGKTLILYGHEVDQGTISRNENEMEIKINRY
jgi:hypothetical protein